MCKKLTTEELLTKIERLKELLLKSIGLAEAGIVDTQAEPFEYENTVEWLEEEIGITREELEELGYGFPEDEEDDVLNENAENQVVMDDENEQLLCPGCRAYVAPLYALKCIDEPVPKFCSECGHKLHY